MKRYITLVSAIALTLFFLYSSVQAGKGGWITNTGATPRKIDRVCRDGYELSAYIALPGFDAVSMKPPVLFNQTPVDDAWFGPGDTITPEGLWKDFSDDPYPFVLRPEYLTIIGGPVSFQIPNIAQPEPINVNGTDYFTHSQKILPFFINLDIGDQVAFGNNGINDIQSAQDCWLFDFDANQSADIKQSIFEPAISWLDPENTTLTITGLPQAGTVQLNNGAQLAITDQFSLSELQNGGGYLRYTTTNKTDEDQTITFSVRSTARVSVNSNGTQISSGISSEPSVSADGSAISFTSTGNGLGTGIIDPDFDSDVFLRNLKTQLTPVPSTKFISRNETGNTGGNGKSHSSEISPDGSSVAFVSAATNFVGSGQNCNQTNDTKTKDDIYIWSEHDLHHVNKLTRLSLFTSDGITCNQFDENATAPSISAVIGEDDSARGNVIFQTDEPLELPFFDDKNGGSDLLLNRKINGVDNEPIYGINNLDIAPGPGVTPTLDMPNGRSYAPQISADGNAIAFQSDATDLIRTISGNPADTNGVSDIYVSEWNGSRWVVSRVSVASNGAQTIAGGSGAPSISQFGKHIAFVSNASNLDKRANGQVQVYVRDRNASCTTLLSTNNEGEIASGSSFETSISANGRFVAFSSLAANLVDKDTNTTFDIFVVDRDVDGDGSFYSDPANCVAGSSRIWRASVASDGTEADGQSYDPDISANGAFVAFTSDATNLVDNDTNGNSDVFVHYLGFEGKIRFVAKDYAIYLPLIVRPDS